MTIITHLEVYPENSQPLLWVEAMAWCEALGDGWRAPTKDELNVLYQHKNEIGGLGEGWLWSSSQYNSYSAWRQLFSDGSQYTDNKDIQSSVRAVRAFNYSTCGVKCPKCGSSNVRNTEFENTYHCNECDNCFYISKEEIEMTTVEVDISDETFMALSKMAHEQDITFNQLCNNILRKQMEKKEKLFEVYKKNLREIASYVEVPIEEPEHRELQEVHDTYYIEWLERKLYDNNVPVRK